MATIRLNVSERTERLLENIKCRTEAASPEEVVRKALLVYNLVGTAIEQGHKVVIGLEPISLMEFVPLGDEPNKNPKPMTDSPAAQPISEEE